MSFNESQMQECLARMDIMQLFAKYAHIVDECRFSRLSEVFTDDAEIDYTSLGESVAGLSTTITGASEFEQFLTSSMEHIGRGLTHFMGNHLIDVAGGEADIVTNNHVLNLPIGGYYRSHARHTADGWKIDRFKFEWRDYQEMGRKMGYDLSVLAIAKGGQA